MGETFFMYVDESGDYGKYNPNAGQTASRHYALIGIIIPISGWLDTLDRLINLRKDIKDRFGFPISEELHGAPLFNPRGYRSYKNSKLQHRRERMKLYHYYMSNLPTALSSAKVIPVYLDKETSSIDSVKYYEIAWLNLLERFQTHIKRQEGMNNFGILIPDDGNEKGLRKLSRRLRRYNPTTSKYSGWYDNKLDKVIEDPFHRTSKHSYFIQSADMVVHALYRQENPKGSYKRFNAHNLFAHISPLLNPRLSNNDPRSMGIKRL